MERSTKLNSKSPFRGKVLEDARKDFSEEKRKQENELFKVRYNKPKEYQFPTKVNMEQHFYLPKGFVSLKGLTKSAMAIYPVLCSMSDFDKYNWIQLSRENIAKISGVKHTSTVDKGIESLSKYNFDVDQQLLEREFKTEGKRHFYVYKVGFIRKELISSNRGNYFIFHNCIITSGIWAKLSLKAKALYLAMRSVAKFDYFIYSEIEDIEFYFEPEDIESFYQEEYKERKWDVCTQSLAELCRMVDIDQSRILSVVNQLEFYRLVEYIDSGIFKVYLKPRI